jgi:hypothetical protein
MAACERAAAEHDRGDLALAVANLNTLPDKARVQRVVARVDANKRIRGDPRDPAAVDVGWPARRERAHHFAFLDEPVDRAGPQRLVRPGVRFREPVVELQLKVEVVREAPAGLEVRLEGFLEALNDASRLGIRRLAEEPVDFQHAAERSERIRRPAAVRVQAGLAIPHQTLRERTQRPQAAPGAPQQVLVCLLNTSAPAPAREYPRHATTTNARRVWP